MFGRSLLLLLFLLRLPLLLLALLLLLPHPPLLLLLRLLREYARRRLGRGGGTLYMLGQWQRELSLTRLAVRLACPLVLTALILVDK